jgi:hypothetical protein
LFFSSRCHSPALHDHATDLCRDQARKELHSTLVLACGAAEGAGREIREDARMVVEWGTYTWAFWLHVSFTRKTIFVLPNLTLVKPVFFGQRSRLRSDLEIRLEA